MGETSRSTWKQFERVVARYFGAERTALSGSNSKISSSDSTHPRLYIECKYRNPDNDSFINLWEKIKNGRLYYSLDESGLYLLMHIDIFKAFSESYLKTITPLDRLRTFREFKAVKGRAKALITLYKDSAEKAEVEGKIPLVARKVKNRKGWAIFFKIDDLKKLYNESKV